MVGGLGAKDILIQLKGDSKNFKGAMSDADKSMGSLTKSVQAYGPAMAAGLAVGAAAFIGLSVKMAAAEEVVNRQTESMLKSQGIMWSSVKGEVTDYINELERLTAYGDTDLQMAFNRMSSSGLNYKETMESMKTVTDIAYTRNIDLVAAADLVSKAYNGQGSALKRYGIIVENGVTGLEALNAVQSEVNANFADAADRTETLEGKMDSLNTMKDDFMEGLGNELIPEVTHLGTELIKAGGGADELSTFLGSLIAMPVKLPRLLFEHKDMMKDLNQLRDEGVDTEKEMIDYLGLHSDALTEMSDKEFEYNTKLLTAAGYHDKTLMLIRSRIYGMEQQNSLLESQNILEQSILDTKEQQTKESEEQLSIMDQLAAKQKEIAQARGTGGISGAGISEIDKIVAAGAGTREIRGRTITYSGNNSGAP
ncbi:hypothetical protein KAR91_80530 [Candidatus Pacearchaeota archaeon]|nr:hypothetical protein [Candidatus Pacearchaeota archaeon]